MVAMPEIVDKIIQFETEGFETEDEYVEFFQKLIDSGLAWSLQGSYGRTASYMIEEGFCVRSDA
jgi:hypothetical protein